MIARSDKTLTTNLRRHVQFLSYKYDGTLKRKDKKDGFAKSIFPERQPSDEVANSKALGYAVANVGEDAQFHYACEEVFNKTAEVAKKEELG